MENEKDIEKVIAKIKKVLELSKNNPSEEEAKAAALKAQRLMAEYHISVNEVNTEQSLEMAENMIRVGTGNKWKYSLAEVVANNFRCKTFVGGSKYIFFYGHKEDVEIASMTFEYLFNAGNKTANKFYNHKKKVAEYHYGYFDGTGIKNSFLIGYIDGIKSVLERQSTELMIVVPKEVNEAYIERSKHFRTMSRSALSGGGRYASEAYQSGVRAGKDSVSSKRLSA